MNEETPAVPGTIFSSDEANERVRQLATRRLGMQAGGDAISTGIPFVDEHNPPLTRGDLAVVVGLTSEGKSMLVSAIAKHTINEIKTGQRQKSGAVVIALTEETIEARRIQLWGDHRVTIKGVLTGRASLDRIDANIHRSREDPLYFIGDSAMSGDIDPSSDDTYGALTVRRIAASVAKLVKSGVTPELLIIDHAHDLATEHDQANEQETYDQVSRQLVRFSSWLRQYCPMIVVAQANKSVMQRSGKDRMPTKYDLAYMGAVARRARDMYSIWYPSYHVDDGAKLKTAKGEFTASKGLFLLSMTKGRYGEITGRSFPMTAIGSDGEWSGELREMG